MNPDKFEKFMQELYEKFHMYDRSRMIDYTDIAI
jgi:hypothetical protein